MPHSQQAKKRLRQNEKERIYNRSVRSEIKTLTKSLARSVEEKNAEKANALFREISSKLDKAARRNVYHRNTAARRKSKAAAILNALGAQG
jgi:small subunit ribosomal protein S20